MSEPIIGLALGSGSARGWAHIGVIEALAEAGIKPQVVTGTSIGALVGAAYVTGEIEALDDWVRSIDWWEMLRQVDLTFSRGGLLEGDRIMGLLTSYREEVQIESLEIPFAAVATDLESGREIWFREGSLREAVRASMALPGVLTPMQQDGRWLVDGGLADPVPITPCRALGATTVIAVNLNGQLAGRRFARGRRVRTQARRQRRRDLVRRMLQAAPRGLKGRAEPIVRLLMGEAGPGYFDVTVGAINIMQDQITRARMAGDPPDVLLEPRVAQIGLLEFNRAEEAIEEGRACVKRSLAAIRESLGEDG
ncbi:MAG: patatin-like phospholipase RssA [Alphaproteobacteria bacterium]|nr:patatin-like phospholipase RssA [Alphaproteobacteria bacterium]